MNELSMSTLANMAEIIGAGSIVTGPLFGTTPAHIRHCDWTA